MIIVAIGFTATAQTAIGKTTVTNPSCLLEFGTEARGIRLPLVVNTSTTPSPGTIVFDTATGSLRTYNGSWSAATAGGSTGGAPVGADSGGPVIIGANNTAATGAALVLEASDKALVVPRVEKVVKTMQTPVKGLMVWDPTVSGGGAIAVYNGVNWIYY